MPVSEQPIRDSYDVVIVGGAIVGSSVAWYLSSQPSFDGTVLVVERDMTFAHSSTAHTNSCMRQQFSNPLNIEISQFAADVVRDFPAHMGGDPEVPELHVNHYGYMYLAGDEVFAETLRENQAIQASHGAGTKIFTPAEIKAAYPFYEVSDLVCGSHNLIDEGYFDSGTMFQWWQRKARLNGVEFLRSEVTGLTTSSGRVATVEFGSGHSVACGYVVNAAGPRASVVAEMAGVDLPVEPRKRYTYMFKAEQPLAQDLPLTIDPNGVHVRTDGDNYMAGCTPDLDPGVDYSDFAMDHDLWEDKVWPTLAHRIPAFERIKVVSQWAGHYAHNTLDHNVIVGPHPETTNLVFANGFSGHGLQQSPAIGRGVAELISHGEYQTLDLSPLGYERIVANEPFIETAII